MDRNFRLGTSHGFTLIELLTVIAIIGILAAILIPVVGKVRESAHASACLSKLRQLHMGMMLAAEDNGERIPFAAHGTEPPEARFWHRRIASYVDASFIPLRTNLEIFRCRSDETPYGNVLSFGINNQLATPAGNELPLAHIENNVVLLTDATSFAIWARTDGLNQNISARHSEGTNVVFIQGNASRMAPLPTIVESPESWRPY